MILNMIILRQFFPAVLLLNDYLFLDLKRKIIQRKIKIYHDLFPGRKENYHDLAEVLGDHLHLVVADENYCQVAENVVVGKEDDVLIMMVKKL